jgi:hypothetical protein
MAVLKTNSLVRGVLFMFVFVLLSVSSVSYKHAVALGIPKYISLHHELRRILGKAERENFRRGVITDEGGSVSDMALELAKISLSSDLSLIEQRVLSLPGYRFEPIHVVNRFSPVLNL